MKGYGEAEFYLAIVKVIAIVGFIILGVVLVCGGGLARLNYRQPGPLLMDSRCFSFVIV